MYNDIMKKICIISNQHISYNPRVLKEADALKEAGYNVRVITVCNNSEQHRFDQELMASRKWEIKTVNYRRGYGAETVRWFWTGFRKRLFEKLSEKLTFSYRFAERTSQVGNMMNLLILHVSILRIYILLIIHRH